MQGALERTHDNQYHLYNVDGFANTITEGAKVAPSCPEACYKHRTQTHAPLNRVAELPGKGPWQHIPRHCTYSWLLLESGNVPCMCVWSSCSGNALWSHPLRS